MKKSFENFSRIMTALQVQYDSDITYACQVGEAMGVEINPYNNTLLVESLVKVIDSWFDEDVISEINSFMYDMNFGRHGEGMDFKKLWIKLNIIDNSLLDSIEWKEAHKSAQTLQHAKNINDNQELLSDMDHYKIASQKTSRK